MKILHLVFSWLLVTTLSGCLVSTKPLFPSGHLTAQTPLKPGWYFKYTIELSKGNNSIGVSYLPTLLEKKGQWYESYIYSSNKPDKRFQLFDSSPDNSPMIAQSKEDKDLWGYARVDFTKDREIFMTTDHKCGKSGGNIDPAAFEYLRQNGMKTENALCIFSDPILVSAAALAGKNWPNADIDWYRRIPNEDLIDIRKLKDGPITIDQCNGDLAILSADESLGITSAEKDIRRHGVSASRDSIVTIEAKGNTYGNWAYLLSRAADGINAYCKPDLIIKVAAIFPNKSNYTTPNNNRIAEICAKNPTEECGTLEEMISRFGGHILVQGIDVVNLPKGKQAYGAILTVLGNRGRGNITILASEESGLTRVLTRN